MKRHRKPLTEELNMIRKIVWSYSRSTGLEYEDLFSEGCLAYLEALDKFDPSKSKISTFIYHVVSNRMNSLLQKNRRRNDKEVIMPEGDFDFLAEEVEDNPEQYMTAEENWMELCGQLSPEAMMVVEIMNGGEIYVNEDKIQLSRRNITNALKDFGWKQNKIWGVFRELRKVVASIA